MTSLGRVLVVGDANPDLVLRGDVVPRFGQVEQLLSSADLVLGGSAAIAACGLARLGVPTALVAVVGDDLFGRLVLDRLTQAGVSTEVVAVREGTSTGLSVHLSAPDDRAILTLLGTIPVLDAAAVRAAVRDFAPTHVHVASPFLTPAVTADLPQLLAEWRAARIGSSLDTNWDPAEQWAGIAEAIPLVDVLLPNAAELDALTRVTPVLGRSAAARESSPHIVVKDGADGGWSLDVTGTRTAAPGIRIDVVDTTGAGDSFDAGYIAALMHGVTDEAQRLRWATVAGSLSTRAAGGTDGQATLDELRAAL